jgi:stage III sporulation protein SpoIIIAA
LGINSANLEYLVETFTIEEVVVIDEIGTVDPGGWATCKLSDGSMKSVKNAVKGQIIKVTSHPPGVEKLEKKDTVEVTPWRQEARVFTKEEIERRRLGK